MGVLERVTNETWWDAMTANLVADLLAFVVLALVGLLSIKRVEEWLLWRRIFTETTVIADGNAVQFRFTNLSREPVFHVRAWCWWSLDRGSEDKRQHLITDRPCEAGQTILSDVSITANVTQVEYELISIRGKRHRGVHRVIQARE